MKVSRRSSQSNAGVEVVGPQRGRQQRVQQVEREIGGLDADVVLLVLEHHVVHAVAAGLARLAEGDVHTGGVLHLDHDMFEHMAQPGAFVFRHAADEAARLAVAAAMFAQAGQPFNSGVDKAGTQSHGRPGFEHTEVHFESDDREVGVVTGPDVDVAIEDLHAVSRLLRRCRRALPAPCACAGRTSRPARAGASRAPIMVIGSYFSASPHGRELHLRRVDDGDGAGAHHVDRVVGADEGGGVFVDTESDEDRIVRQRGKQPAQSIALAEVLIDDDVGVRPKPGTMVTIPARGVGPSSPHAIMCSRHTRHRRWYRRRACRRRLAMRAGGATGVPPRMVESRS